MTAVPTSSNIINASGNAHVQIGDYISYPEGSCLRLLQTTNPKLDKARIEEDKGGLLCDLYKWVLDNDTFRRWRRDERNSLLWIRGDPGKGKTLLLCGIIDELEKEGTAVSYFFCQANDDRINSSTAVLRNLIYMLVDRQRSLRRHVQKRCDNAGAQLFEGINAWFAVRDIFMDIVHDPELQPSYLVVDALDECHTDRSRLLKLIVSTSSTRGVKWLVSSRNWPDIEQKFADTGQQLSLELNAELISAAVRIYIQMKVSLLAAEKGYDKKTEEAITSYLSSNAEDTFLWVSLVCKSLGAVNRFKVLKTLQSFPAGLNALYARMMQDICLMDDHDDVQLCLRMLSVASVVYRPVTLEELGALIDNPFEHDSLAQGQVDDSWLEYYIKLCGSFLVIRKRTIYFVHQSAKDFTCDPSLNSQFSQLFPQEIGGTHNALLSRSLQLLSQTLRRDMYQLSHPGFALQDVTPPTPDPLKPILYSSLHWVDHLIHSWTSNVYTDALQDQGIIICDFLSSKYLNWLEALSLAKDVSGGILAIEKLHNFLQATFQGSQLDHLVWDMRRFVRSNRVVIETAPLQTYVSALIFSPTESLVRKSFREEEPRLAIKPIVGEYWDACEGTFEGHSDAVCAVAFSADGRQLASASWDKTVKLWDIATGLCSATFEGHRRAVCSVAFSPDGRQLASASWDKTVKLWDIATGCRATFEGHSGTVYSVAFSPDGRQLASASDDSTVKLWDISMGRCIATFEGHSRTVLSVAFSADGRQLASASYDETVKLWDIDKGCCRATFEGHSRTVSSVVFSRDGRQLASASYDETIKLWEITTGRCLATFEGHSDAVSSIAFSADGRRLASASYDETVKLWDVEKGRCTATFEGHSRTVSSVAFSADGLQLASASYDEIVKIWDVATDRCSATFEGHSGTVSAVAFSAHGRQFASASYDETIKLWDIRTGRCLATFGGHRDAVSSIAFSVDGRQLASASYDGTIKLWDIVTGNCTATIQVEKAIHNLSFDATGTRLDTEIGPINLAPSSSRTADPVFDIFQDQHLVYSGYGTSIDDDWITYNGENIIWLPSAYRPVVSAVNGTSLCFGCMSGRVWFLQFTNMDGVM